MKNILVLVLTSVVLAVAASDAKPPVGRQELQWGEKYNSAGAKMELKETGRQRVNGRTVVSYRLYVTGLPKDGEYMLMTRLAGMQPKQAADAYLNGDGLVVSTQADPAHGVAEDPIDLRVFAGKGEPKMFGLISSDGEYKVFGEATPFPIENASGACRISAKMLSANYQSVLIQVSGLAANEAFEMDQRSEDEGGVTKAQASADGSYTSVVMPYVKGKRSGKVSFKVRANSCKVGVEFAWGEGSYQVQ
jgi:hypothetical protein